MSEQDFPIEPLLRNALHEAADQVRVEASDLDHGDLKFNTDFRDVYAPLLAGVLDTEPAKVLGGWTGSIPQLLS